MNVPFVDLNRQYGPIQPEIDKAVLDVLHSRHYILGPEVEKLERNFADYCGSKYAVGVSSGTAALCLALKAVGIKADDKVILPANTYIATANACSGIYAKYAKPILADVNPQTYNIERHGIAKHITKKTKAIVPVHLYGQPCDVDGIIELAKNNGLKIVWDACQAHGSLYKGKNVGNLDDIVCFSFYPSKNMGGVGDGGIITTNNEKIAKRIKSLRNYGRENLAEYEHSEIGDNARLDEIQAAHLNVVLKHLDHFIDQRIYAARLYTAHLLGAIDEVTPPAVMPNAKHVYHLYVIRAKKRDELQQHLKSKGIGTKIHYPIPIYRQEAYRHLKCDPKNFPITEASSPEILSLPMFPGLKEEEIRYVVDSIKEFYAKK